MAEACPQAPVGVGDKPFSIPDEGVAAMQSAVGSGLPVSPWPFNRIDQAVCICEGPLQGLEGILDRKKSGYRIIVNMELLHRAIAVGIEPELVRVVAGAATASFSELYRSW